MVDLWLSKHFVKQGVGAVQFPPQHLPMNSSLLSTHLQLFIALHILRALLSFSVFSPFRVLKSL